MDAIRLGDNKAVMLKKIYSKSIHATFEQQIAEFVSSAEQLQDPDNHCIPVYETLKIPGDERNVIIVMPLLREWHSPRFDTVGECLDLFQQIFKVCSFKFHESALNPYIEHFRGFDIFTKIVLRIGMPIMRLSV